jgi:hypothetical protein
MSRQCGAYRYAGGTCGETYTVEPSRTPAAVYVSEDLRRDQISDPAACRHGRTLFFGAKKCSRNCAEVSAQIHKIVIGEHADDPVAPTAGGTELIVATAADRAEPATAASGLVQKDLSH